MTDENEAAEYLGRAISSLRAARGLKRMDLKRLLDAGPGGGLSYPYLADIENGRKYPAPATLGKIANALDTTAFELQAQAEALAAAERGEPLADSGSRSMSDVSPGDYFASAPPERFVAVTPPLVEEPLSVSSGRPGVDSHQALVDRITDQVFRQVEPRFRDMLKTEIRLAVLDAMLRERR